jgi:hypothetical protein
VRIVVIDRDALRPLEVFRRMEQAVRETGREAFRWRWEEARKMLGSRRFQSIAESGADPALMKALFDGDAAEFEKTRRRFLLY